MFEGLPCRRVRNVLISAAAIAWCGAGVGRGWAAELTRCNGFNDASVVWAAVADGADRPMPLRGLAPAVLLPDGSEFKTWEPAEPVQARRTFFVAQGNARASDENPGSEDRPWKTLGRAARVLEPGDRVVVKRGVYREWVRPARGGVGPAQMITYEAAQGEEVVLSGADPVAGKWVASSVEGCAPVAGAWMLDLPAELFGDYNLFVNPSDHQAFDLRAWQAKTGLDAHSRAVAGGLEFSAHDWTLRGLLPALQAPRPGSLTHDFCDRARAGQVSRAGPFGTIDHRPERVLVADPWFAGERRRD